MRIQRTARIAAIAVVLSATTGTHPATASHFSLSGGKTGPLGYYVSIGWVEGVAPDASLFYGLTSSQVLGPEVRLSLTRSASLSDGWNLSFLVGRGGVSGDYRVDLVPEITLSQTAPLPGTFLNYTLQAGVGNYVVRPVGLSDVRGTAAVTLSTPQLSLSPVVSINASAGYTQYAYGGGSANGAWWGSPQLSFTFSPSFSTSLTHYWCAGWGASPLLFDALCTDNYVQEAASLSLLPQLALGYSQAYSFVTSSIIHRVYSISVTFKEGYAVSIGWDDVTQQPSLSLATP